MDTTASMILEVTWLNYSFVLEKKLAGDEKEDTNHGKRELQKHEQRYGGEDNI
jgi:hypothetical protein